jgi:hypothetical protein
MSLIGAMGFMEGKDTEGVKEKFNDVRPLTLPLYISSLLFFMLKLITSPITDVLPFVSPFFCYHIRQLTYDPTAALISNWKVWPLAQAVNFSLMPLPYRVP